VSNQEYGLRYEDSKIIILLIVIISFFFTVMPVSAVSPQWQESEITSNFVIQGPLVIGDGRNDGFNRVYSGDGDYSSGRIYEISYYNNQWQKIDIVGDNSNVQKIYGLGLGNYRNDGINRLYASGLDLAEYYYDSDLWIKSNEGTDIKWTNDFAYGKGRNDDYIRIYLAGWDEIYEISYNFGDWDVKNINTGGQRVEKLLVTDGRNDNVYRLYAAISGHIYEYSFSEKNEWQEKDCGAIGDGPYIFYSDLFAGNGRNDGKNRIYFASGGLYELSYEGTEWDIIKIANSNKIGTVFVGIGRNDGVNRVYSGSTTGIGEYTFSNGEWKKTSNFETEFEVNEIALGEGRNDGLNYIYATGGDKHIYEYRFVELNDGMSTPPETPFETAPPPKETPPIDLPPKENQPFVVIIEFIGWIIVLIIEFIGWIIALIIEFVVWIIALIIAAIIPTIIPPIIRPWIIKGDKKEIYDWLYDKTKHLMPNKVGSHLDKTIWPSTKEISSALDLTEERVHSICTSDKRIQRQEKSDLWPNQELEERWAVRKFVRDDD